MFYVVKCGLKEMIKYESGTKTIFGFNLSLIKLPQIKNKNKVRPVHTKHDNYKNNNKDSSKIVLNIKE